MKENVSSLERVTSTFQIQMRREFRERAVAKVTGLNKENLQINLTHFFLFSF